VQIVNRFIELYSDRTIEHQVRSDLISNLFDKNSKICSLKTSKELIVGSDAIRSSFASTLALPAEVAKRMFIEPPRSGYKWSYCLDCYAVGATPGLGDRSKEGVVLYKCNDEAHIAEVYGMPDKESLASRKAMTKADFISSNAWMLARNVIEKEIGSIDDERCHFHDYSQMETWG